MQIVSEIKSIRISTFIISNFPSMSNPTLFEEAFLSGGWLKMTIFRWRCVGLNNYAFDYLVGLIRDKKNDNNNKRLTGVLALHT